MRQILIALLLAIPFFGVSDACVAGEYNSWSQTELNWFRSYKSPFSNPFFATTWGAFWMGVRPTRLASDVVVGSAGSQDYERPYPITFALKKDKEKKVVKADVLIFVSGMFSSPYGIRTKNFMKFFVNRGYHVYFLPNPWSVEAIEAGPHCSPGSLECEGNAFYGIVRDIAADLHRKGVVDKIHIVGESYGTLLAAIMMAKDAERSDPIFNGRGMLISPILSFSKSFRVLDKIMDDSLNRNRAANFFQKIKWLGDIVFSKCDSDRNSQDFDSAQTLTAYMGFNSNLAASVTALDKIRGLNHIPLSKPAYKQWGEEMRFSGYLKEYAPELSALDNRPQSTLPYWLERTAHYNDGRLKIMGSLDDFLNINSFDEWSNVKHSVRAMVPGGGHSGFVAMKWFNQLMELAWGNSLFNDASETEVPQEIFHMNTQPGENKKSCW